MKITGITRQKAGEAADALYGLLGRVWWTDQIDINEYQLLRDLYDALRDAERTPDGTGSVPLKHTPSGGTVF